MCVAKTILHASGFFSVYIKMIDRRQQKEQLVLIPAYCFSVSPGADVEMQSLESVLSVPVQVIYENASDVWINVR